MPIDIDYQPDQQLICIRSEGQVSLDERLAALNQIADMELTGSLKLLVDVRKLSHLINGETSNSVVALLKQMKLPVHKIAVVQTPNFKPYTLVISDAFIAGFEIEEFSCPQQARNWLTA